MPATTYPNPTAEYVADWPRTGRTVRLYLDGTSKPRNFDAYVMTRPDGLGPMGLIHRANPTKHGLRVVEIDEADKDELLDELQAIVEEMIDESGYRPTSGPQASLLAIYAQLLTA